MTSPASAELDAADSLAHFRQRFALDGDVVAYFDGNSLGRLPLATGDRIADFIRLEWGQDLIRGWERWVDLPTQVGDELAPLIGAAAGQVVVADSTSVCLYKMLHAAASLRGDRTELVVERHAFPTDRFLAESVARERGWTVRWVEHVADLADVISERTAFVLLGHVDYRTGELHDLVSVTGLVHGVGAVTVWDLCHSVGVLPVELDLAGVDFAVGCTYKYLNAGPGAPAFMYVAARHLANVAQPINGWWSTPDIFDMQADYTPADGVRRMLSGTAPVIGLLTVQEGVRLTAEAGISAIRAKSLALTDVALSTLQEAGLDVIVPRDHERRGGQVSLRHGQSWEITEALVARGVVPDFRPPDLVRLGFSPLTTSFAEAELGLQALIDVTRSLSATTG